MRRNSTARNLAAFAVMLGIIAALALVVTLRDYTIQMDGVRPVLVARISIPRPNNVHINNNEIGKLTVSTASKGNQVGGYEFRISRFENMAFAHSFRSVDPKKEIGKLKPGKRYYVQARCYKQNQMGRNVFGRWSSTASSVVKEE
ncbi:MAG: hypothetical protein IJ682_04165 [Lachnospiraceae bacterium]|nr:hypothetical protein [Lachnospiraceae bacterium]